MSDCVKDKSRRTPKVVISCISQTKTMNTLHLFNKSDHGYLETIYLVSPNPTYFLFVSMVLSWANSRLILVSDVFGSYFCWCGSRLTYLQWP